MNKRLCVVAGLLLLGTYGTAVSQLWGQGATATILGTITDPSGAAIPEVAVQVRSVGTGITQSVTSDAQGRFRVPDLGVGEYEIQASKTGFSTVVHKGITLTVGSQNVVDFSLPVGQQQQTVTVEGQATQVETTNASLATFTSEQQMRELPLNGRNFEQLIQLAPGVATVQWSTNAMQGRAAQYSVAGSRPEGQAILLDDENLQSFWNNGMGSITGSSLGVEAIGEFQTLTNTYSAQFGGNGAVVNAVSKSGTNAFHGSAFDFLRNSALDARDLFATRSTPPAFRRNQYGGSVGGPVRKDKAFFFADYEGIRQLLEENKTATVPACNVPGVCTPTTTNLASALAIANTLAIYPLPDPGRLRPGGLGLAATYGNQTNHEDYVLGRFDYTFSAKDSIFVRYVSDKASLTEPFAGSGPVGGGPLNTWHGDDTSHTQFSTIEERHIVSPTLINVARMSFSRPTKGSATVTSATVNGVQPLQFFSGLGLQDGQVTIQGNLSVLGAAGSQHHAFFQNRYTWAEDMLWTHGAHSIRFGAFVSRLQTNSWNPITENAAWVFTSFSNFLAGTALSVSAVIPGPGKTAYRDYRQTDIAPYVQDDWKVTSKLTVNMGLRWQFMTNPSERLNRLYAITDYATSTGFTNVPNVFISNPSWKNYDPRIGLAWDPFADHKTSVRAGVGFFHDPISIQSYQVGFGTAPPWSTSLQQGTTANPLVYPFMFTAITPILPSIGNAWQWRTHTTPYMIQYNFNIQREIAAGTVFTVGYVGSHGVHLISSREMNPPIPTIENGIYHFTNAAGVTNPRVNQNLSGFPSLQPITTLRYNSLQTVVNRRFTRSIQAQAAYTYSKCLDIGAFGLASFNGVGFTPSVVMNPFSQRTDRGPCSYDITHVLRVNGTVALPFHGNRLVDGWQVSGILSRYSGVPFNVNTGFDRAGMVVNNTPRPNYISGCDPYAGAHTITKWFNPACYSLEPIGTFGNTGRNTLRGPGFFNTDIALTKDTKVSEQFRVQFRAEFFNIFNHPNLWLPGNNVFTAPNAAHPNGDFSGTAGVIIGSNPGSTPRQIQFGLKLNF